METSFHDDLEMESIDLVTLAGMLTGDVRRGRQPRRVPRGQGPRRGDRPDHRRHRRLRRQPDRAVSRRTAGDGRSVREDRTAPGGKGTPVPVIDVNGLKINYLRIDGQSGHRAPTRRRVRPRAGHRQPGQLLPHPGGSRQHGGHRRRRLRPAGPRPDRPARRTATRSGTSPPTSPGCSTRWASTGPVAPRRQQLRRDPGVRRRRRLPGPGRQRGLHRVRAADAGLGRPVAVRTLAYVKRDLAREDTYLWLASTFGAHHARLSRRRTSGCPRPPWPRRSRDGPASRSWRTSTG